MNEWLAQLDDEEHNLIELAAETKELKALLDMRTKRRDILLTGLIEMGITEPTTPEREG